MKPTEKEISDKAWEYAKKEWHSNDATVSYHSYKAGFNDSISQMQPEWVSVTDRLPETLQSVICELKNGAVFQLTYGRLTGFFDPVYGKPVSDNNPVVQWTRLPQPPTK